jgi:hypothetical protein
MSSLPSISGLRACRTKTFKQVQDADLGSYEKLLEHLVLPRDTSELKGDLVGLGDKARNLRQAHRRRMATAPLTLPGIQGPNDQYDVHWEKDPESMFHFSDLLV